VNRNGLQDLSKVRLKEATALLNLRMYDGAYYLAGYAVECALKACIAK
jgi:HEPN domain-containing protein